MMGKRKTQIVSGLPILVCFISMTALCMVWIHCYRQTTFGHMSWLCERIISNCPDTRQTVLSALKEYDSFSEAEITGNVFLEQYGYRREVFCRDISYNLFFLSAIAFGGITAGFLLSFLYQNKYNQRRISELTYYLEQVNVGAAGTLIQTKEDGFSQLQDEIYKTVTSLSHTKEAAVSAKINFADNLANISHQLKTPLTAISLSLQLMKQKAPNTYAGQIEKQLSRLKRLNESLLTLSQIDAGALHLEHSPVDVYTALNLACENLGDLLAKEQISVFIPDNGCVEILGDLDWTMEALMNLMKNCMEHSPKGGCIHCDYSQNPLYTEILIWDDVKGFASLDIPHLFERFYRGTEASENGIGIGLSLARAIFELQNGTITARNRPEGGACFEIRVYCH